MRITLVGPGLMPIPPTGWGAVEILIWDFKETLEKKGHEVSIVNEPGDNLIISKVNESNPDFVHIQYDDWFFLADAFKCKNVALTSHFAYLEQPDKHGGYKRIFDGCVGFAKHSSEMSKKTKSASNYFVETADFKLFCLSEGIKNTYQQFGAPSDKLFVTPNGARNDRFRYTESPIHSDKSIYVAKIDSRKRQYKFQNLKCNLYFVGNHADSKFNIHSPFYLGEWDKPTLYNNLTDYANLVLLSDGEAHPLVCVEALMAGLGLVVSEYACANLDLTKEFITVIPEEKINDNKFIANAIKENREKSIAQRSQIREYALSTFDYNVTVENYLNILKTL